MSEPEWHSDDESLVGRAARRVLGAATVSAKIDGEMVARLDARVAHLAAEHGRCTRADVIRSVVSALRDLEQNRGAA